jgi:hypothetical protein
MTAEIENLILEHLRIIRSDMSKMTEDVRGLRTEMTAIRQHLAGVVTLQELHHNEIASLKVRLDRVEKRLDLVE